MSQDINMVLQLQLIYFGTRADLTFECQYMYMHNRKNTITIFKDIIRIK